jgi:phospholipase D
MNKKKYLKRLSTLFVVFILGFTVGYSKDEWGYELLFAQLTSNNSATKLDVELNNVELCFTPASKCTGVVTKAILEAKKSIYVQAYGLTSSPIGKALIAAHKRGVVVKVLLDRSNINSKNSRMHELIEAGIDVKIDRVSGIAHNKVMIVDENYVVTGSFNFTNAADLRNVENLLVIQDKKLAKAYLENWQAREQINELKGNL